MTALPAPAWARCATIIVHYLSNIAVDPHRGFELTNTGRIAATEDPDAQRAMVAELVDWIDALDLSDIQLDNLDKQLVAGELPTLRQLREELE